MTQRRFVRATGVFIFDLVAHESSVLAGAALRSELEALRLKELRQRAREQDVSPEEMEEAADSDEPKAAMVELLMRKAC